MSLSHQIDPKDIEPGDHIYSWRTLFIYAHHGIYVGEDKVIHFGAPETRNNHRSGSNLSSSSQYNRGPRYDHNYAFTLNSGNGVFVCSLNYFIGSGSLYRYKYGVSAWEYSNKLRAGTMTIAPSDPPQDVIARANYLLQHGFGAYHLTKNNCEDFALYCKTSLLVLDGASGQTEGGNVSLDIGVRPDAIKVKVEDARLYKTTLNTAVIVSRIPPGIIFRPTFRRR